MPSDAVRVLCLSGVWPFFSGNLEAANVVSHAIVGRLAADPRFDVAFACVGEEPAPVPQEALPELERLESLGVTLLPQVMVPKDAPGTRVQRIRAAATADARTLIRGTDVTRQIQELAQRSRADVVLTIWSEVATAAAAGLDLPKMAYYGNIDFRVVEARMDIDRRFGVTSGGFRRAASQAKSRLYLQSFKRAHLQLMRRYDLVADVSASDAELYRQLGVRSRYLRNMWPVPTADWTSRRAAVEVGTPLRIVGNVGNLSATGNTFGMYTLATEIVPALRRRLGPGGFEIHLFGGRRPHPGLDGLLDQPEIRLRGFVPDLDAEILMAPIFLVANNHSRFRVGHTRFLHAWSLGSACVAFTGSTEAMPELVHGSNVLLGDTSEDVADAIVTAGRDPGLRRRLGEAGAQTLIEKFDPDVVCATLTEDLLRVAGSRSAGSPPTPSITR